MAIQALLQKELMEYLKVYPDADVIELAALRHWVRTGHSPYGNGDGICDEKGREMDFIAAMRLEDEMYQKYKKDPEAFLEIVKPSLSVCFKIGTSRSGFVS